MRALVAALALLPASARADEGALVGALAGAASVALVYPTLGIDDAEDTTVNVSLLLAAEVGLMAGLVAPDELGWDAARVARIGLGGALGGLAGSAIGTLAGGQDDLVCGLALAGLWGGLVAGVWLSDDVAITPTRDGLAVSGSF